MFLFKNIFPLPQRQESVQKFWTRYAKSSERPDVHGKAQSNSPKNEREAPGFRHAEESGSDDRRLKMLARLS